MKYLVIFVFLKYCNIQFSIIHPALPVPASRMVHSILVYLLKCLLSQITFQEVYALVMVHFPEPSPHSYFSKMAISISWPSANFFHDIDCHITLIQWVKSFGKLTHVPPQVYPSLPIRLAMLLYRCLKHFLNVLVDYYL